MPNKIMAIIASELGAMVRQNSGYRGIIRDSISSQLDCIWFW
jgi:hypothetical protein